MILTQKRIMEFGYNPETKVWQIKCGKIDSQEFLTGDLQSVKNWYAIESDWMGINRHNLKFPNEFTINMVMSLCQKDFEDWRENYPEYLFPNEEYIVKYYSL